jgi:uncharacterized protein YndB with AHSA1/START domain
METPVKITHVPVANAGMLIRKPVAEVFEAFVDPAITSRFWFSHGSARLQEGRQVRWDWRMYDVSVQVAVKAVEQDRRILIEWGSPEATTTVEWQFTARPDHTTFVDISNRGFQGNGDEVVKQALDSTGGFALVLAGAKAFLEHGIALNLVADRFPDGL